jgi:PPK2 family polyphosphate:nucleotide phosphotransferase
LNQKIEELVERFRCTGQAIDLRQQPTLLEGLYESKKHRRKLLKTDLKQLADLQRQLYIEGSQGLLIILQGIDTAGKDGIIRHLLKGFNPQGCGVYSFGVPNSEELSHDFLWRTSRYLPARGRISVFNRSQYEEVLVVRVHPELLESQHLSEDGVKDGSLWAARYEAIVAQEHHLIAAGTRIVKLMLHISPEEQKKRLLSRLSDPKKNWKFNENDIKERGFWDDYVSAYSACISATSTPEAPWYVLPADDKPSARLLAGGILIDVMKDMHPRMPEVTHERAEELSRIEKKLAG